MGLNQFLELKPSYWLTAFFVFTHLGAMLAVVSLPLPWFVILPLVILVLLNLINNLRRYALQLSSVAIIKIFPKQDAWLLQDKQGNWWQAKLAENSFYSLYWIVLNFKRMDVKKKISIIILPDSLEKDSFRRLRAKLHII